MALTAETQARLVAPMTALERQGLVNQYGTQDVMGATLEQLDAQRALLRALLERAEAARATYRRPSYAPAGQRTRTEWGHIHQINDLVARIRLNLKLRMERKSAPVAN